MLSSIIREVKYEIVECSRDDALLRGPPRTSWLLAKTGKTFLGKKYHTESIGQEGLYTFSTTFYITILKAKITTTFTTGGHRTAPPSCKLNMFFVLESFLKSYIFIFLLLPKSCFYGFGLRLGTYTTFFSFIKKVRKLFKSNRCIWQRNAFI